MNSKIENTISGLTILDFYVLYILFKIEKILIRNEKTNWKITLESGFQVKCMINSNAYDYGKLIG